VPVWPQQKKPGALTMATERQIAANRRNARKSTGPRTRAGKKRASRNSYRHGFSYGVAAATAFAGHIEALAQKIAGRGVNAVTLEIARSVARAEFELAQIRRVKVAMIVRISEFGAFEVSNPLGTFRQIKRILNLIDRGLRWDLDVPAPPQLPSSEPERSAEAVRRTLPELLKLDRYERRAAARRDCAARQLFARKTLVNHH
jgi:hypothetical protein